MSGKPKGTGWGGHRSGAGRPAFALSQRTVDDMLRAAKVRAKTEGRGIDEILLDIIYHGEPRESLAAIRLFKEFTIPKASQQEIQVTKTEKPTIFYPEKKPDPAKLVPLPGGKPSK